MLGHHYDVIANAAISQKSAPKVIYLHHGDHNPALGATRTDFIHTDVSPACFDMCSALPALSATFLGLSVKDNGIIDYAARHSLVGATCAHHHKFVGRATYTYGELLAALFAGGVRKMYHIGEVPQNQQEEIKAEIAAAGQDAERMIFLPNTPSLSGLLKELSPGFFLISHPIAGGKATVEAMSLGLPLLFPRPPGSLPLMAGDMSLGNALVIESLADAPGVIAKLQAEEKELGQHNREIFDRHYSMTVFREKLLSLLG